MGIVLLISTNVLDNINLLETNGVHILFDC